RNWSHCQPKQCCEPRPDSSTVQSCKRIVQWANAVEPGCCADAQQQSRCNGSKEHASTGSERNAERTHAGRRAFGQSTANGESAPKRGHTAKPAAKCASVGTIGTGRRRRPAAG